MVALITWLFVALFFVPSVFGQEMDAERLIARMDELMRGATSYGRYEMIVTAPRWQRTVVMDAWSEGTDKSFIRLNYPRKDKGITFLRIDNEMWQFVPKIEKIVKIPPSLMLQSWLGSDFTNDDLVKESSLVEDYVKKIVKIEGDIVTVELTPHETAPVVWGSIIMEVDQRRFVPLNVLYYDEEGVRVRQVLYQEITKIKDRYYPMKMEVLPLLAEKQGRKTSLLVKEITFDEPLPPDLFTIRSLKSRSQQ